MPLKRNQFIPQNMLQIYTSASGMTDLRTGLPYMAGGLMPGDYFDLTEAEAQALGYSLHSGRYRFVQIDAAAVAANVAQGRIGAMKSLAQGVNFITDFSQNIGGAAGLPRGVVFINNPTPAQILAGCYLFVQELGDASVLASAAITAGAGLIVGAGGQVATGTTINLYVGTALAAAASGALGRCILELPIVQG